VVVVVSSSVRRFRMVVFPALSRPSTRIRSCGAWGRGAVKGGARGLCRGASAPAAPSSSGAATAPRLGPFATRALRYPSYRAVGPAQLPQQVEKTLRGFGIAQRWPDSDRALGCAAGADSSPLRGKMLLLSRFLAHGMLRLLVRAGRIETAAFLSVCDQNEPVPQPE
jgi:hypothetical protein